MKRVETLRASYAVLWERMVTHPFVWDLGSGHLPRDVFAGYMAQDYLFIDALVRATAGAIARAPGVADAKPYGAFMSVLLGAEDDLFRRVFGRLGYAWPLERAPEPKKITAQFTRLLTSVGKSGTFRQIAAVLYVTEGTYADWAARLVAARMAPSDALYREWIDIHADPSLAAFVAHLANDAGDLDGTPEDDRVERGFKRALTYELRFWNAVYPVALQR